jgi:short-subunit dehydrogenase
VTAPEQPRTVLITGASSGIGRATAHLLAAEGANLVLASRSDTALEQTRQECVSRGAGDVLVVPTDVGDRKAVESLFDRAVAAHGRVDAVVHSAAVVAYGTFTEIPAEVFDHSLQTNVTGAANVARSALQHFTRASEASGGSLIVVGSVLGKIATPYMSPYITSKWALHGLVRTLQIEARETPGVHVSLISPGGVNTPIYAQAGSYTGHPGHPPPPVTSPERVAREVVRALDRPQRDRDVGIANGAMVAGFRILPAVFDTAVAPLMRLLGQGRDAVEPHPGNVFEPVAEREAVRGRWPRIWG